MTESVPHGTWQKINQISDLEQLAPTDLLTSSMVQPSVDVPSGRWWTWADVKSITVNGIPSRLAQAAINGEYLWVWRTYTAEELAIAQTQADVKHRASFESSIIGTVETLIDDWVGDGDVEHLREAADYLNALADSGGIHP